MSELEGKLRDQRLLTYEAHLYLNYRRSGILPANLYDMPCNEVLWLMAIMKEFSGKKTI